MLMMLAWQSRPVSRLPRSYNEFNHTRNPPGTEGRPFAYFVQTGGRFLYASAIRLVVLKALVSLSVSVAEPGKVPEKMKDQQGPTIAWPCRLLLTPWP